MGEGDGGAPPDEGASRLSSTGASEGERLVFGHFPGRARETSEDARPRCFWIPVLSSARPGSLRGSRKRETRSFPPLGLAPVEFDDAGAVALIEEIGQRPDRRVRMVGTARAAIARRSEGAKLIFELGETAGMMHLALRIAHRDRLGAHRLAAARGDEPHGHIGIGGLDRRAHHLAAEIRFGDNAIGAIFMKGRNRTPPPNRWRFAARAVREYIAIPAVRTGGDDNADFIGAEIVASRSARRIERDDHGGTLAFRNILELAARGFDHLISPERALELVDVYAFVEPLALALREIGEAFDKLRREIFRIVARIEEAAGIILWVGDRMHRNRIALLAEEKVRPMRFRNRVQIDIGALHHALDRLREPREGDESGRIRYLRGLVQEDAHIFETEDFFDARFVVEPADPDPRSVRQFRKPVLPTFRELDAREREPHHIGQSIERDRSARRIGMKAQDGVARSWRLQGARDNSADDQESFAGACAAGKANVALRPFEQAARTLLPEAERHHATTSMSLE